MVIATCLAFLVLEAFHGILPGSGAFPAQHRLRYLIQYGNQHIPGGDFIHYQGTDAVLQLGVTMDYSIFLLNSYEENKLRFPGDKNRAMGHAISNTFKSIVGSSVTTIAGFAALCCMTFTLGRDLGIVMARVL